MPSRKPGEILDLGGVHQRAAGGDRALEHERVQVGAGRVERGGRWIGPPYFQLDERALLAHFSAAARACAPLRFYVYESNARAGACLPRPEAPWRGGAEPGGTEGLGIRPTRGSPATWGSGWTSSSGRRHSSRAVSRKGRSAPCRRSDRLPARRRGRPAAGGDSAGDRALPAPCGAEARPPAARRPINEDVAHRWAADRRRATGNRRMAGRIVVAGAGAVGASMAYHLALLGARGVCSPTGRRSRRARGEAMGGVRRVLDRPRRWRSCARASRFSANWARRTWTVQVSLRRDDR